MIKEICEKLDFPADAGEYLEETLKSLSGVFSIMDEMSIAMDNYFCENDNKYAEILEGIAEKSGVSRYTIDMIFLLLATKPLYYIYKQKNIPEEIYWDTIKDLKNKLLECKKVYGVWGMVATSWFQWYYTCDRFALGRLQFEKFIFEKGEGENVRRLGQTTYNAPIEEGYRGIKYGEALYNCHIPSSGPLKEEDVIASFKKAYEFYNIEGTMTIICGSWLLYPPHYEVYPENSNLRKFYELFDVISSNKTENNPDAWRVFNTESEDYENLPEDTTLQRRFKKYLIEGNKMGSGFGVILFDGEKIIK